MMANSSKSKKRHLHDLLKFGAAYFPISALVTIGLIFLSYKDVLYLRFSTELLGETHTYSEGVNQLLFDGFSSNLLTRIFSNLPFVALIVMFVLVAYSVISTFVRTYDRLNTSKNYVNAKRVPASDIVLMYIALRTAAFTVPLLYWCFYLAVWFPHFAKLPLKYIVGESILPFMAASLFTIILLSLLTHIGVVLSRLAIRLFKRI